MVPDTSNRLHHKELFSFSNKKSFGASPPQYTHPAETTYPLCHPVPTRCHLINKRFPIIPFSHKGWRSCIERIPSDSNKERNLLHQWKRDRVAQTRPQQTIFFQSPHSLACLLLKEGQRPDRSNEGDGLQTILFQQHPSIVLTSAGR
ncbi:hypothetical protein CDAR_470441 [Caerostris darwini]|uniref:Uncharacterized protein n=1 Tax=Caerostris darwini TaxID=1538125 RepID=A0AAV4VH42_9ARAC|nr:hypothetical protein CDAR_470441 [Caerostris darwini]